MFSLFQYHPYPKEMRDTEEFYKGEGRPHQCDLCGKRYKLFRNLKAHIAHHMQRSLRCIKCFMVLKSRTMFHTHMMTHNDVCVTCTTCGRRFTCYENLQRHQEIHARAVHKYLCDLCGQTYQYYSDLRTHLDNHSPDARTHKSSHRCKCAICGSIWENRKHLEEHMNIHYKEIDGMFHCSICDKGYARRDVLVEHSREQHFAVETGKNYICQWCGKIFTRGGSLWTHERNVHASEGTLYQCDKCNKNFMTTSKLKLHQLTHNGIKKYSCEVCGKEFGQASSLGRHRPIHTGEKKHSCSYCDFKCIQLYSLKRHILTHTGQKPHKCDLCGEQFRQIFALTKHKRKHHFLA